MELVPSRNAANGRKNWRGGFPIVCLVAVAGLFMFAWPAWQNTARTGVMALLRSLSHRGGWIGLERFAFVPTDHPKTASSQGDRLARHARSMEFRIQHLGWDPALLRAWNSEWKLDASQKKVMLPMLLRQLPGAAAQKNPIARNNLADCIFELTAEGRRATPKNGFFRIAESLALFYLGQEKAAILALKQIERDVRMDAGLRELNDSEAVLWSSEKKPWTLFDVTPRNWGLDLHRPLYAFSRALASQEKNALQRYSFQQATELGMIHLDLAARVADAAWTASDVAVARAVANRAMEPFWVPINTIPTPRQVEEHFINFLEEQGDAMLMAGFRSCMERIAGRERAVSKGLPVWRRVQQLASWNAPGLLACLSLQTTSMLLVWLVLPRLSKIRVRPENNAVLIKIVPSLLAFALVPAAWALGNWPSGGTHLVLTLGGGWLLWSLALQMSHSSPDPIPWRISLTAATIMMLTATLLTMTALSLILEFRERNLAVMLQNGWRGG